MKDISFLFVNYIVLNILQLEAEDVPEISEKYEITAVPTFIFIKVRGENGLLLINIVNYNQILGESFQ